VIWFRGCTPEVLAGPDGRIVAVGAAAKAAAGRRAEVVELAGEVLPGLGDAHLHLQWMARQRLEVELGGSRSVEEASRRIRRAAAKLPRDAWVIGRGWYNDVWSDPRFPGRRQLDEAAGGRPAIMTRKDGHSAWVSTAAFRAAGVGPKTPDPAGGVIDREPDGTPAGIVRERALDLIRRVVPVPTAAEFDRALAAVLRGLVRLGLTQVHTMDGPELFASLQRLHARGGLPLRVVWNLPYAHAEHAERLGIRSGWGDEWLRIWGIKAFLDGSLGSRTAEMLDGGGVQTLGQAELEELCAHAAAAELNVCLHAIGDRAVRRALDALEPHKGAWALWRPRIEHAQCVDPADVPRFSQLGVIPSMQPVHAVSDRELADREWPGRTAYAYAWRPLLAAGAVLAFGSDAPVEHPSPWLGLEAATTWRRQARWHPELALTSRQAVAAYTAGVAYAAGMEKEVGRLRPGLRCDLTVASDGRPVATVVGGRLSWRSR
jgi:predicted amidohydrolase YtcJ